MIQQNGRARTTPVVWARSPWERRDYATVMDGWVVRYNVGFGTPNEVEVSASGNCVHVHSVRIRTEKDGISLLDVIQRAWRQHLWLKGDYRRRPLPEAEDAQAPVNGKEHV